MEPKPSLMPLVVIVGPTASGKTALAIELARRIQGEIICADSRTVYKGLDIGTAKPTVDEQREVPHHLLDVVTPDEPFTVADFKRLADEAIIDISTRQKIPVLVGGSGLYVDAVIYNYKFRERDAAKDILNPRHLSPDVERSDTQLRKNTLIVGLKVERDVLRTRITERVDEMVASGFLDEVRWLMDNYRGSKALDAPGYKAFRQYLDGEISLGEAKSLFVRNDVALAKRQMTWFRRNSSIRWFDDIESATNFIISRLAMQQKR